MDTKRINIAIDGPAGAGKSTIAKAVAKKLNIIYLDTGAMYRSVAYFSKISNVDISDIDAVAEFLKTINMEVKCGESQQIFINGLNVTPYIREHYISKLASDISAIPCVRLKMVELQRSIGEQNDVVLDGRDIGIYVFPNSKHKFYITASVEIRAQRRFLELEEKGESIPYENILNDIKNRDYNDTNREFAPLKQAEDSIYIDTTNLSIDEAVIKVLSYLE